VKARENSEAAFTVIMVREAAPYYWLFLLCLIWRQDKLDLPQTKCS